MHLKYHFSIYLDAYFDDDQYRERVSYLLYMIAISPEFNLQY